MEFIELSGAEKDVVYKLGKYGAQNDGDLPSKSGMCGLVNKGLAEKNYMMPYPNFLNATGLRYFDELFGNIPR